MSVISPDQSFDARPRRPRHHATAAAPEQAASDNLHDALKNLDRAGIVGPPLFLLIWIVLGLLDSSYSFLTGHGSDLALGPLGWVMTLNFLVVGVLVAALGIGRLTGGQLVVGALVILVGLGLFVSGIFTADRQGAPVTTSGTIHNAAFPLVQLAIVLTAVAGAVLGRGAWRLFSAITALLIVALTLVFLTIGSERHDPLFFMSGLIQLAIVAAGFGWLTVLALRAGAGRPRAATA